MHRLRSRSFKVQTTYESTLDSLEGMKRDNRGIQDDIKDG